MQNLCRDSFDPTIDANKLKITYKPEVIGAMDRFRVARRALQASGVQINIHVFYVGKGDTQAIHPKIEKVQRDSLMAMVLDSIPGNSACEVEFLDRKSVV